jgi:DNA modification methylase
MLSPPTPYYQDEAVTIYHGDCREILPKLAPFDLLLTDPPYGIKASNMTMGKGQSSKPKRFRIANKDWDSERPDILHLLGVCESKCIWGGNYFTDLLAPTNHWLVWHKKNDGRSFSECEFAWTDFGKQARHFAWSWVHGGEEKLHKTQKPVALMRWCLSFAPDAETILDPFAGSGTTGVAAKLEGRKATLIELDERYCEIAANRLSQGVLF